jgi:phosphomannomutase
MSIFKAYDIRGTYPDQIDEDAARAIGRAFVKFLGCARIVVTHDMRTMAPDIRDAFAKGAASMGADVIDGGLASTPMNYFAIGSYGFDAGVQITASHNPAGYIGFKMSRAEAVPISADTGIRDIERMVQDGVEPGDRTGEITPLEGLRDAYREHVLSFAGEVKPLRVAIDCANGMGGLEVPLVFPSLPCEVLPLYFELDGTFPNHEANPLKISTLRDLQDLVRREGADLGVAFDGDADRAVFLDEAGEVVTPDLITALVAEEFLRERKGPVIYDVRSSRVVPERIRELGGTPIRERVGHSFMKARMRKEDAVFAGEYSGHYYFRENYCADSAILATMKVLTILSREGRPFSELVAPLRKYRASGEVNFEVEDKQAKMEELAATFADGAIDWLDGITVSYPRWWFNVRPSNTEPLLRLNLEAETPALFEESYARVLRQLGRPVGA